ncbi:flagellar biosynthetic protein FliR [Endozoicomonas sp. 8E]|uniref:flagellar biosynthetic protein FliR n=1 Tax=Endozoicomonas sp. 8E TaxID=3035692 RepID=UPI002938EB02|nr:flagellar biosynthetic protein FliR [Endozoicomonas sp. 8E]WOG29096.1 flagellar biosynthetic protein FliR [Endozoicomonas sp. 8E]
MGTFTFSEVVGWIGQYLWPFFRIGALFLAMPIINSQVVAPRIRIILAMAITIIVAPMLPAVPAVEPLSGAALLITAQQLAVGLLMAMVLQIYFAIFTSAGQMLSLQMGLGMAVMFDPMNGAQIPVISQVFQLLSFLMFLAFDGHLVVISIVVESFNTIPIAPFSIRQLEIDRLPAMGGWMFASALLMVLPAIVALLIVTFTFGVMNRSAPQFNIFSLGFPLTMLAGIFILMLISSTLNGVFTRFTRTVLDILRSLVL